jgi:putative nucleotidyltransferase with HDIG domain
MVAVLFILTVIHILQVNFFPDVEIVSVRMLLFVTLLLVCYLWIQLVRDYHGLVLLNTAIQEAHGRLQTAEIDTIAALIKAEEEKDLYTTGHSERVAELSTAIANEMGLNGNVKTVLGRAAILHDIGKIGIVDSILYKPASLTDSEWIIMRSHPEKGVKILEPLKFLAYEREIILRHHERYDGRGYPRGLKGEDIGIEASIIAVADSFEAMSSERPYRKPLNREHIINELKNARGTQHAPAVVDALFRLLEKSPELWKSTK